MLRLLRPKQWTKNVLLFAALVFAKELFDAQAFATACLAFVAFCLASSSAYVVNDLVDAERDRLHPDKRHRPIASGEVSTGAAVALALALTVAGLGLAFRIGAPFGGSVITYIALTHFYSFVGKNVVVLDIMLIAAGFVIRAVAGALAIDVPFSDWFVLCTLFGAMFIALSKRRAEIQAMGSGAARSRPVLERYSEETLTAFIGTTMAGAVISYTLYVQYILQKFGPELRLLAFTVPFVIFGIFRYHLVAERTNLGEKPEELALRDRPLQASLLGFAVVAVVALYAGG